MPAAALRIMPVDDNADAAVTLGEVLKANGHAAEIVTDPAPAVAAACIYRPDIFIPDIGMRVINGYDPARRLRQAPGTGAAVCMSYECLGNPPTDVCSSSCVN